MDISTAAIVEGRLQDKYGCRGTEFTTGEMPSRSFPLKIESAPAGTASFAVVFDDPDSVPVCGFRWVHWLVAGLTRTELQENASQECSDLVQGCNDWYRHGVDDRMEASVYGGPYPPDREHTYVITVLALDIVPALKTGFSYDDLKKVAKDHVLAKATLKGKYAPRN